MLDPTRIPHVMAALQRTWEAQPNLTLTELLARLAARGASRVTTDEEFLALLGQEIAEHPEKIEGAATDIEVRAIVRTEGPTQTLTIDPWVVVTHGYAPRAHRNAARSGAQQRSPEQPTAWDYLSIDRCRPGAPLRITDANGVQQRLGVVRELQVIERGLEHDETPAPVDLSGLRRGSDGTHSAWLVLFSTGSTVIVEHRLHVARVGGRHVEFAAHPWVELRQCRVGAELRVDSPVSMDWSGLGVVRRITPLRV
ncbi:hypothetical protein [Corynebacterium heidelbergense]|uniref:Uncharacterized protein n=1 Tax=Corynebacterium heidelbergense TaxID=2055947 RepID=A0A364V852_9CORY|nr:hypothetical protein [Corynebacterium heidelbergense]RAV32825.1 hypothetical protein DLJ54_01615 [Corynebacterium heidelbergense]